MKVLNLTDLNKLSLSIQLDIFKRSRLELSNDFITEYPEIYNYMFKYENNIELLELSMEKYFITWINHHWEIFIDSITELDLQPEEKSVTREKFLTSYKDFLNKFNFTDREIKYSALFITIIEHKIKFISDLLAIADSDDNKFNLLYYKYNRDKALFDRQIQKFKEK